jgi:hypothetical protein
MFKIDKPRLCALLASAEKCWILLSNFVLTLGANAVASADLIHPL